MEALRRNEFECQGRKYTFDNQGDINQGYDVTLWRSIEGKIDVHDIVAEYSSQVSSFTLTDSNSTGRFHDLQVTSYPQPPTSLPPYHFVKHKHSVCLLDLLVTFIVMSNVSHKKPVSVKSSSLQKAVHQMTLTQHWRRGGEKGRIEC